MREVTGFNAIYLLLKNVFGYLCYYLVSFLFKRNKKIWIYGSYGGSFKDNPKYFFLYCNEHLPSIKHVWISRSKEVTQQLREQGFHAYNKVSLHAIYFALIAKVYIYSVYTSSDIFNGCLRGNAYLFNFWHGVPYKKIEHDIKSGPARMYQHPATLWEKIKVNLFMEPKVFRTSDTVLTTSEKLVPIFSSAFQLPKEKILVGPYPRNSIFFYPKDDLLRHIEKHESASLKQIVKELGAFSKVIIYMPTFRDTQEDFMDQAFPDLNKLHELCKENNVLFLFKVHTLTRLNVDFSKFHFIKNLDNSIDVYPLLPFTDALISDYSSIIFDYSLLRKKIIFYAFDKEEYLSKNREAYFEYEKIFTDNITSNFEELLSEIRLFTQEPVGTTYDYPLSASFHENNSELKDIAAYIKSSINYN